MQVPDRSSFSGELRVERVIASSLPRVNGRVSPYLRIVYVDYALLTVSFMIILCLTFFFSFLQMLESSYS